ncbi:MAG: 2-dehydro-3-deoxyphosphogluconate aldolase/(4S)-4-hydroxy-2-oxoglutarate aldolase [Verrucomicrobiales bacterium]|jgi:2-dehydro-3-deoxyphosphogluconate aldolase/(4S)-4-hydroxy-2-oxoglutarate aldolase
MTLETEIGQRIAKTKIIAVLVIDRAEDAVPLAKALLDGGVEAMELTLRTPAALDALREVRENVPEMLAGIGTVLTIGQVDEVVDAGAHFGVSPGVNQDVIRHAQNQQLPFGPGVMTPTDIDQSVALGCRLLKFFPASSSGGLKHLKNIAAPFAHLGLGFIPLGGISAENMREYLDSPLITAIGGSWLAPRDLISAGNWAEITRRSAEAREIAGS